MEFSIKCDRFTKVRIVHCYIEGSYSSYTTEATIQSFYIEESHTKTVSKFTPLDNVVSIFFQQLYPNKHLKIHITI